MPELFSIECWGGATFDVAMRFLKDSPWQRLDGRGGCRLHERIGCPGSPRTREVGVPDLPVKVDSTQWPRQLLIGVEPVIRVWSLWPASQE